MTEKAEDAATTSPSIVPAEGPNRTPRQLLVLLSMRLRQKHRLESQIEGIKKRLRELGVEHWSMRN